MKTKKFNLILALGSNMVEEGKSEEAISDFFIGQGVSMNEKTLALFVENCS